jgi:hypothetical protein
VTLRLRLAAAVAVGVGLAAGDRHALADLNQRRLPARGLHAACGVLRHAGLAGRVDQNFLGGRCFIGIDQKICTRRVAVGEGEVVGSAIS